MWVNCEQQYLSRTYNAPFCHSAQCARANTDYCRTCPPPARPGCHNNTCGIMSVNPVTRQSAIGELVQDVLAIQSSPGVLLRVPQYLFVCAPSQLLQKGLPLNVQCVVGFGHSTISLPNQLVSNFALQPIFAMCLTSSPSKNGIIFFGPGPYNLLPGRDFSRQLVYTPLIVSPAGEYYIQVSSIRINSYPVPINPSLLQINYRSGSGGTLISTTNPFTVLEHSIFVALSQSFAHELLKSGVTKVKPEGPFGMCFNSTKIISTQVGPAAPNIDLLLDNQKFSWRISGPNSLVQLRPGITCLGFVDGGSRLQGAAIAIGAAQLEDNLVQFDFTRSMLGFSYNLLYRRTSCGNFNLNSTP